MNACTYFSHLFFDLGAVRYKRSAHNAVVRLWVPWKSAKGRPYLSRGHKVAAKPYDVFKVKDVVIKSVYGVTECTIGSLAKPVVQIPLPLI
jgi:hypothetical protein